MKYLLFFLLPLFSPAQNINIPDPVLKAFLAGPGFGYHLDTNGDGEVSQTEALALTNFRTFFGIGIGGVSNITDFTGLEHFSNLQRVEIIRNYATTLNLNNLPNLKEIRISGFNSTGSANLDVYSPIVSLNVDGCTALEKITLSFSSIQSIDLTTNTAFKEFYAEESKLETINFNGLALLEKVEILNRFDQYSTFDGMLNEVTFSGNTALTHVDIRTHPDLHFLDFTGANNLTYLFCSDSGLNSLYIQNLPNLKYVYCKNNQITQLNLSGLINLETIDCQHNQIQTIDFSGLSHLTEVVCNNNQLQDLIVSSDNTSLLQVDCSFNQLTSLDFENLIAFGSLKCTDNLLEEIHVKGTNLRRLDCTNNNLTELDLEWLQNLNRIKCSNNHLGSINMKHVIENPYDLMSNDQWNEPFMDFTNNPLLYACVDDFQIDHYRNYFSAKGMSEVNVSATCEFEPVIYPNPIDSILNIRNGSIISSFNIYDMNGRLVMTNLVNSNTFSGPISELQAGVYILEVIANNSPLVMKIVKN